MGDDCGKEGFGKGKGKKKGQKGSGEDYGFEKGPGFGRSDTSRSDRMDKRREEDPWAEWFGMGCGKGGFPPYWMGVFPPYWGGFMPPFFDDSSSSPSPERVHKSKRRQSS